MQTDQSLYYSRFKNYRCYVRNEKALTRLHRCASVQSGRSLSCVIQAVKYVFMRRQSVLMTQRDKSGMNTFPSVTGHFGPKPSRPLDTSAPSHLGPKPSRPHLKINSWTLRPLVISAPSHLGPTALVTSAPV